MALVNLRNTNTTPKLQSFDEVLPGTLCRIVDPTSEKEIFVLKVGGSHGNQDIIVFLQGNTYYTPNNLIKMYGQRCLEVLGQDDELELIND